MTLRDRGQTTLDFTIGVTIFIVVLAGVFLFVPGTLQPFEQGDQEDIVTVNRVADQLTEHSLVDPSQPHILDDDCTVTFFEDPSNSPSDCNYSGGSLQERVGHGRFQFLNVTIRGRPSGGTGSNNLLCYETANAPGDRLETGSACGDSTDTLLAVGGDVTTGTASVTARRVVELDGQDVFMVVEIW
jgi:hypothetical protein